MRGVSVLSISPVLEPNEIERWPEALAAQERGRGAGPRGLEVPTNREELYAQFQPLVRRLMRQYSDDPELGQELPGEIFCRFCTLLDAYDPARGIPLRPYLVKGLTVSVYTFVRSQWRRRRREIYVEPGIEISPDTQSHDPTRQWDHRLANQDVLKALPDAIVRLPERQRQVVISRFYEGRSFEEIAETLGIRPATARSLLRHGVNNLRRYLARDGLGWA